MTKALLLGAFWGLAFQAQAQTSSISAGTLPSAQTSTISVDEALKNKKFEDDREITDSKLKADSGSLSKYSLKASLSYFGPPVGDLGNKYQPNPDGSVGVFATSLGGSLSGRYRIDKKSAVSVGTGVSALTPFHGVERTDVKTPFVGYDLNNRIEDLQLRHTLGASVTTIPNYRDVGQVGTLSFDNSFVHNLGASGFAAGLDMDFSYFLYERGYQASDRKSSTYHLGLFPQIKYNFSDKMNVYTSVSMAFWSPRSEDDASVLWNKTLGARLGMGMAFTRSIYFAPYISMYPENLRAETTTLSFSTIFSVL